MHTSTIAKHIPLTDSIPVPCNTSPIPDLVSCSDSDNNNHTPHYILNMVGNNIFHYLPMPTDSLETAIFSQDYKFPPITTAGAPTPALLCAFQMGSLQHFSRKKVPIPKQVPQIIWGLHDPHIQNWYVNDTAWIDALPFKHLWWWD
jgi:hypothetical protein